MALLDPASLRCSDLPERVLALLQNLHPLPCAGYLAGQAVASAIDRILGTGTPVFNDIDVFVPEAQWPTEMVLLNPKDSSSPLVPRTFSSTWTGKFTDSVTFSGDVRQLDGWQWKQEENDYAIESTHRSFYSVLTTKREGLLNSVMVRFLDPHELARFAPLKKKKRELQMLLSGFDINCTQVGIDLEARQLVYTPAFERYFATRQLQIVALFTPIQSTLRYFKKRKELGAYGNDEAVLAMLANRLYPSFVRTDIAEAREKAFLSGKTRLPRETVRELLKTVPMGGTASQVLHVKVGTGALSVPLVLGAKYKEAFDRFSAPLTPWLRTSKHPQKDLWFVSAGQRARRCARIVMPSEPSKAPALFLEQYLPASKAVTARVATYKEMLKKYGPRTEVGRGLRAGYREMGYAYLVGIDSQYFKWLLNLHDEHSELSAFLSGMPLGAQIQLLRTAREEMLAMKLPDVWGAFARCGAAWGEQANKNVELIRAKLQSILSQLKPVVSRLPLPVNISGVTVRELVSGYELLQEGQRMRHCVGGYVDAVARGYCRIVSLSQGTGRFGRSTTEWGISTDMSLPPVAVSANGLRKCHPLQVELQQTRTFANEVPNASLLAAEASLRAVVNAWMRDNPREAYALLRARAWESLTQGVDQGLFRWATAEDIQAHETARLAATASSRAN